MTTSELSTKTTQLTTFYPRFSRPISAFIVFQLLKTSIDKPKRGQEQPETHHNSPQTPKTRFIHNEVVRPPLLTLLMPGRTSSERSRQGNRDSAQRKKPHPRKDGAQEYAGDHLISHTLTRAVPSAQRGLTSVFGMGTGVTLAVNSPAMF